MLVSVIDLDSDARIFDAAVLLTGKAASKEIQDLAKACCNARFALCSVLAPASRAGNRARQIQGKGRRVDHHTVARGMVEAICVRLPPIAFCDVVVRSSDMKLPPL